MDIVIFLLVLSVLILVHEFGHFIVARLSGVYVEEFGIGLPPRLVGKKFGETIYSINLLPFGGFVKLHGESGEEKLAHPARAFINKSKKLRVAIVVAGVVMNFILAVGAFAFVYTISGIPRETSNVKILEINEGSPAQTGGLLVGDVIRKINDSNVSKTEDFIKIVEEKKGENIVVEVERTPGGKSLTNKIALKLRESPPEGQGPLGVVISTTEIYFPSAFVRPFIGIYLGIKDAFIWGKTVVLGFAEIIAGLFRGVVPKDLAGPVGIFAITSEATRFGPMAIVNFLGILSINLAVLNVVPFPALDGGRLLFIAIEAILGKKVVPRVEAMVHTVGMIILLMLIFAITAHDIQRLIAAGSVSGFIDSILK